MTMTSYHGGNKTSLSLKPCIPKKVTIDHYQEVMVALLESVVKNRLKRPLVEKSRWRHIQLAIKPRYLGNSASQIKKLVWCAIRKSWSIFQNPLWKNLMKRPWQKNHDDVIYVVFHSMLMTLSCIYHWKMRELSLCCLTALSQFIGVSHWMACNWIQKSLKLSSLATALDS